MSLMPKGLDNQGNNKIQFFFSFCSFEHKYLLVKDLHLFSEKNVFRISLEWGMYLGNKRGRK